MENKGCRLINLCKQKHLCCYYCNKRLSCELACKDILKNCRFSKQLSNKIDLTWVTDDPYNINHSELIQELPQKPQEFRETPKKDLLQYLRRS